MAYVVSAPIDGRSAEGPGRGPRESGSARVGGGVTALGAIGLAFVGGIILNLMPCVFPVLFLKGLRWCSRRAGAWGAAAAWAVYALGILVSFWVVVGALLVVRASGSHVGWGFQLQSPVFIAVLASFLFFFGLSLAGQFDLGLSLTSVGGELAQKPWIRGQLFYGSAGNGGGNAVHGSADGGGGGVCAGADGWGDVCGVHGAGAGAGGSVSSAELAAGVGEGASEAWGVDGDAETVHVAVPFWVAIWLAWVYGQLYSAEDGVSEVGLLLACFLVLAVAGWALGRWPARWGSGIAAVVLIVLGLAIPFSQVKQAARGAAATAAMTRAGRPARW